MSIGAVRLPATESATRAPTWSSLLAGTAELFRLRLSLLVLFVVTIAGLIAQHGVGDLSRVLHAVFGTMMVAASASVINQWLERRADALMHRTADRPLASGRLSPRVALGVGMSLGVIGTVYLIRQAGWQPATWAALSWLVYVVLYTPLKSRSPWNTAVGAVSGALTVWVGWTAAGAPVIAAHDPRAVALFLVVFLWQFPHFMAIAWIHRADYARAGMKMYTVVEPSGRQAGLQAICGALWLLPISLVLTWNAPPLGALCYGAAAFVLGTLQLALAIWFYRSRSDESARMLFRYSLFYLPALLGLVVCVPWF